MQEEKRIGEENAAGLSGYEYGSERTQKKEEKISDDENEEVTPKQAAAAKAQGFDRKNYPSEEK